MSLSASDSRRGRVSFGHPPGERPAALKRTGAYVYPRAVPPVQAGETSRLPSFLTHLVSAPKIYGTRNTANTTNPLDDAIDQRLNSQASISLFVLSVTLIEVYEKLKRIIASTGSKCLGSGLELEDCEQNDETNPLSCRKQQ